MFGAGNRKNKLLQIIHKKMSNPESDLSRRKGPMFNLFEIPHQKLKLKKSQSIHEFKEELLKQAV